MSDPLRITGDAGTRSRMVGEEGLVIFFGFRLSREPDEALRTRIQKALEHTRPKGQASSLVELEGPILWLAAREIAASEVGGQEVVHAVRSRAAEAIRAASSDEPRADETPDPKEETSAPGSTPGSQQRPRRGHLLDPDAIPERSKSSKAD